MERAKLSPETVCAINIETQRMITISIISHLLLGIICGFNNISEFRSLLFLLLKAHLLPYSDTRSNIK